MSTTTTAAGRYTAIRGWWVTVQRRLTQRFCRGTQTRRAAAETLGALIRTRGEMLHTIFEKCTDPLIDRFKEREQSVQLDVLTCFDDLLQATFASESAPLQQRSAGGRDGFARAASELPPASPMLSRHTSSARHVEERIRDIVAAVTTQLQRDSLAVVARTRFWRILCNLVAAVRQASSAEMVACLHDEGLVAAALVRCLHRWWRVRSCAVLLVVTAPSFGDVCRRRLGRVKTATCACSCLSSCGWWLSAIPQKVSTRGTSTRLLACYHLWATRGACCGGDSVACVQVPQWACVALTCLGGCAGLQAKASCRWLHNCQRFRGYPRQRERTLPPVQLLGRPSQSVPYR